MRPKRSDTRSGVITQRPRRLRRRQILQILPLSPVLQLKTEPLRPTLLFYACLRFFGVLEIVSTGTGHAAVKAMEMQLVGSILIFIHVAA